MWTVKLGEDELRALRLLIHGQGEVGPELKRARDSLELARREELPPAELPWGEVTRVAGHQGVSEADIIWDLAGRKPEPPGAVPKRRRRKSGQRRKASGRR